MSTVFRPLTLEDDKAFLALAAYKPIRQLGIPIRQLGIHFAAAEAYIDMVRRYIILYYASRCLCAGKRRCDGVVF
ncbi:MAG: hypothetical protein ACR5LF_13460 [Symbiopectobacterium sp.]